MMLFFFDYQIILPNTCHGASNGNNLVPVHDPMPAINVDDDPNSCFFEGRYHAPMSTWSPDYDRNCTTCTCKVELQRLMATH